MERKLNVSLVLGPNFSRRLLDVFSPLSENLDVKALGLLNEITTDSYLTNIPLQTFIEDQHLPGYMLGCEEELAKSDVIIASGLTNPSTYQAFRYAYHNQKPFLLFCQRESELKRAMLDKTDEFEDCIKNASGFLVFDDAVVETLEFLGVSLDRIHRLVPEVDVRKFGFHEKLRTRFRDYLKVSGDEFLVVSPLTDDTAPLELMAAMKMLETLDTKLFAKTKLCFVGDLESKEIVKYRAVDLKLTKSVIFISQDIRPFFSDLMSAADLYASTSRELDLTERLFTTLEAMASGVKVLVDEDHPVAQMLGTPFVTRRSSQLVINLREALTKVVPKTEMVALVAESYAPRMESGVMDFLRSRIAEKPSLLPLAGDFTVVLSLLTQVARQGLEVFEESFVQAIADWGSHGEYKGRLLILKGQTLMANNILDEALLAFEQGTQETSVQREAFMGLGKLAFLTHSNEEAMSFYRKALALKPNDADAMGSIGAVYRKLGMADEAVYWLGKSISVDIDNARYLTSLTAACLESEDDERSISLLEQLKVLLGNKPGLMMCLGQLYLKTGDTEKGKFHIDLALEATQDAVPSLTA